MVFTDCGNAGSTAVFFVELAHTAVIPLIAIEGSGQSSL
jgi:hypothetical protein